MVLAKGSNGRWLRKYRIFFFIGLAILAFQFFLAARFLAINNISTAEGNEWPSPSQVPVKESAITDNDIPRHNRRQNISILRLNELSFKPDCEINGKEAVSAIHRAKTQKCKQILANVTCRSLAGSLYPSHLKSNCPNDGKYPGIALGCFKDESNYRLLSGYFGVNKRENSPEFCMQLCLQSGFPYAGVQYSNECFCGTEEPPMTSKLPDSSCNMKCPGNNHATCGGYYTMNIYQTGIKKFFAQIANDELSESGNKSARIVFLLTLNGRALRQVKRLLKILYNEKHYYYIHVDVREDYLFRELLILEKRFNNIRITRRRFATIWGGASLLEMLLSCMNELLQMSAWDWDFVLNLSESDYPVKMISSLEQFLSANKGRNFVKSHGRDTQRFLQKQGLDKTFVECDMRMWRVSDRKLPKGIQMDGGSDWIALSRPFVNYVAAEEPDELILGLKQIFKHTLLPAESFFHTVLRNSKFCSTYVDNNLHVTNWKRKLGCKCQYKHVVDWCGCSPNDFRPEDWARIQSTQPRQLYFARKFEPIINQAVILKLELWLYGLEKPSTKVKNLDSYWQSIYNHLDLSPAPDDALLSAINAVSRHWCNRSNVANNNSECTISLLKTVQATSYHHRDAYRYTLVRFKAEVGTSSLVDLEVAFKPRNTFYKATPSVLAKRLVHLSVSSDFDQKEQISRNFARILSPYSDPVAIYQFSSSLDAGSVTNVSLLWVDPMGALMGVGEIALDENSVIGHSKSGLKHPNLPGLWRLKMVHRQVLVAEVIFLVIPLEFYNGVALSTSQALLMHGGSGKESMDGFDGFSDDGGLIKRRLSKKSRVENSRKTGGELRNWIDELFDRFYVVDQVCAVNGERDLCGTRVRSCSETNWSSFAPDPKSAIGTVNRTTGSFNVW